MIKTPISHISKRLSLIDDGKWTYINSDGEKKDVNSNLGIYYFNRTAENMTGTNNNSLQALKSIATIHSF